MSTIVTLPNQQDAKLPKLSYLNSEYGLKSWLLTGDHKRIAMLYLFSITFFFFLGGAFAGLIRLELLTPLPDLVASDTYNKLFTMHGVIMIFLFLVPSVPATVGNFVIPIMVGAKDLAFPKINLLSWYLYVAGACFLVFALLNGGVDTGWTFTTPLSTHYVNTHVITAAMGVFIAGFSSIFTGLNFIVTIHRMRCPGMTWFRLPLFCWSNYAASILMVLGTPVLAITLVLVMLERTIGIGVFDPTKGGDPLLFPAPFLVLFPSGGVHHDSARHGGDLRGDQHLLPQAGLRLHRGRLLLGRHCRLRILCLGPSHVHHGRLQLFGACVFVAHHAGRRAFRDQDLQLGGNSL
jgi:cytochrome c oxidase subunit 1